MVRQKTTPTKYPGVSRTAEPGLFRIRAKTTDPKTGKTTELDRLVEAVDARAAAKLRADAIGEKQAPGKQAERPKLGPYAQSWVLAREPALKRSTAERYASAVELHIIPAFGDWYLDRLEEEDIVAWRDRMAAAPVTKTDDDGTVRVVRPTTSASSVNGRLRVLTTLLEDAVPRYIARNPAAKVRALREHVVDREPNRLLPPEIARVLAALRVAHQQRVAAVRAAMAVRPGPRAKIPMAYPILLTLVSTGVRSGEGLAFRWTDVDEQRGEIDVSRAHYRGTVDTTKTGARRTVPLAAELAEVLRDHRTFLLECQHPGLAAGWLFPSTKGGLKTSSSFREDLIEALVEAKVWRKQTVHGLRRTFNDLMRQITSGEVVRSMTGHSSQAMTDHYSHVSGEEKKAAVRRGFDVIKGGGGER